METWKLGKREVEGRDTGGGGKQSSKLGTVLSPQRQGGDRDGDRGTKGEPAGFLRVAQCFSKFRAILLSTASGSSFGSSHRVYRVYHSRPCPPPDNFDNSIVVSVRARGSTKRGEKYMNTTLKLELCDFVSKWRPSQTSIRG